MGRALSFRGGFCFYMALEVGNIVEGTVTGIAKFGAFVELPDKVVGLVHISEVANEYVSDVAQYLKVHDKVKVKVISIDARGKIALSIKQAEPQAPAEGKKPERFARNQDRPEGRHFVKRESFEEKAPREGAASEKRPFSGNGSFRSARPGSPTSFEDKLNRFLKDSDERLLDLKRNVESKRGGRGARRSD